MITWIQLVLSDDQTIFNDFNRFSAKNEWFQAILKQIHYIPSSDNINSIGLVQAISNDFNRFSVKNRSF